MPTLFVSLFLACLPAAQAVDGVEAAGKRLRDAIVAGDADATAKAAADLAGLADARALSILNAEIVDLVPAAARAESEAESLEDEHERRKRTLDRKRAIAKDETQRAQVSRDEANLKEWVEKKLEPARKARTTARANRESLTKAANELLEKIPADKRKAEIDRLKKAVAAADSAWEERCAAMECLARLGDKDTVAALARAAKDSLAQRKKVAAELPDREAAFEKVKIVFHREREQLGGNRISPATKAQFEKALKEVTDLQARLNGERQIAERGLRLLSDAVASLPADARAKAAAEVVGLAKSGELPIRLGAIAALGRIADPAALAFLRATAAAAGDPAPRVASIDALAQQRDEGALDAILDKCLKDPEWTIRAAAIQALASIRASRAVPALIAALENEVGRLRDDADETLTSLTGLHHSTAAAWKSWWERSQQGFTPVAASAPAGGARGARSGETVAFAGITTSSKNVAFVVDVSGSMKFGLAAEEAPAEGEPTRFALLKRELANAIERVPDGAKFALITFSSGVTRWTPQPLAMSAAVRKKALDYVNQEMAADGSTNIYGALKEVFDLAGIGSTDKYYRPAIDTIFFLTDGKPSGDSSVTEAERLLEYVRERNRLGKIAVHVVCLGEADAAFLKKLAQQNHGDFVQP